MSQVLITVYRHTGKHLGGLLTIADEKCIECNLNVGAAKRVQKALGEDKVRLELKSYYSNLPMALVKGVFHPPATLVNGRYVYGGEDVPNAELLKQRVLDELEKLAPSPTDK